MSHLDELREESADVAELIEDNEEAVRVCTYDCENCLTILSCGGPGLDI